MNAPESNRPLIGGLTFLGTTAFQVGLGLALKAVADAAGGGGINQVLRKHPWWSLIALLLVSSALTSAMLWYVSRRNQDSGARAVLIDAAVDELRTALIDQLEAEIHVRGIDSPQAIPIRWQNADDSIVDQWRNIQLDPASDRPIRLDGERDDIVDVFQRLPARRLVVLGPAGAGKSVLVMHFMHSMLTEWREGKNERVPVLFALSTWDPISIPFDVWVARELATQHPNTCRRLSDGTTFARAMIDGGRVLYVLDGLDELPSGLRSEALDAISTLRRNEGIVLASREPEYRAAVAARGPLSAAGVIVIQNLRPSDLRAYLPATVGDARHGSPWTPILANLDSAARATPEAALREVLRTPLMVNLARIVYSQPGSNPQDLLSLANPSQMENFLFDRYVAAALGLVPGMTTRRTRSIHNTQRHLTNLARYLVEAKTPYFRWWEVPRNLKLRARATLGALIGCGMPLLIFTVAHCGLDFEAFTFPLIAAPFIASGILVIPKIHHGDLMNPDSALVPARPRWPWRRSHATPRTRTGRQTLDLALKIGILVGTTVSVTMVVADTFANWDAYGTGGVTIADVRSTVFYCLGLGFMFFLAFAFTVTAALSLSLWLEEPIMLSDAPSPIFLVRAARRTALFEGLLAGVFASLLTIILAVSLIAAAFAENTPAGETISGKEVLLDALLFAAEMAPFILPAALIMVLSITLWGRFAMGRLYFACAQKLPFRLMGFLSAAHRKGLLRQTGPAYQFRHLKLRDRLAESGSWTSPRG